MEKTPESEALRLSFGEMPGRMQSVGALILHYGLKRAVEVGVFALTLTKSILTMDEGAVYRMLSEYWMVDPWVPDKDYPEEFEKPEWWEDRAVEAYRLSLRRQKLRVLRLSSNRASSLFMNGSLNFVFIDANHRYDEVLHDIMMWGPKVGKGVIAGHDYENSGAPGVKRAVDDVYGSRVKFLPDNQFGEGAEKSVWYVEVRG